MAPTRSEHDSMGLIQVPTERLWDAQTQRALEHFRISSEAMPEALLHALASVKRAYAKVNGDLGLLTAAQAALGSGQVRAEQFDLWVRPEEMTHPMPAR